jgi:uncharacterized protein (DUF2062 family)
MGTVQALRCYPLRVRRRLRRYWSRVRALWRLARREHSTPREIGWSVAIGVFCGCTPFIGAHMFIALGLATVFRLNRLWAFVGSRLSTSVVLYLIAFCEIELGHKLRHGVWAALQWREVLRHGGQLFGDWLVGSVLVGGVLAALLGTLAYGMTLRRQRARARALSLRTPDEPLPPTSESPPSARPAPTP